MNQSQAGRSDAAAGDPENSQDSAAPEADLASASAGAAPRMSGDADAATGNAVAAAEGAGIASAATVVVASGDATATTSSVADASAADGAEILPGTPQDGTEWRDGVPVSLRFDDPYFSFGGGLDETRHVFLAGNDLPARFRDGLVIAELGFGTGLNLLASVLEWQRSGALGRFRFTSFEAFPLAAADLARALEAFAEVTPLAPALVAAWAQVEAVAAATDLMAQTKLVQFRLGPADVELILGDARHALPAWQGRADIWYLDGFSPARNPELWGEPLMAEVSRHSAPRASFATYTAAGHVRRALEAAGFDVVRAPGYGRKRHMSRGTLKDLT